MHLTSKVSLAAVAFALALPAAALAGSATSNVSVSTTVAANCTISDSTLTFNAYDPLVANATADDTKSNTITYACTKGTSPTIGLGLGSNSANAITGTSRAMSSGGTTPSFLSYEIYKDSAMQQVWGNSGTALNSPAAAPSKAPQTVTMFGKIPGGQDVPSASYTDSVVATINF